MRDAISILDQLIAGSGDVITLAQVQSLLGAADTSNVGALVNALLDADVQTALQVVNATADSGADLRQFARDLVDRLRALLLLCASNDSSAIDAPAETLEEMQQQASRTHVGQLVAWLKLFSNLDFQLKNSPYGQLPLELAVVEALVAPATLAAAPARSPAPAQPATTTPQRLAQPAASQPRPAPRSEELVPPVAAPHPVTHPPAGEASGTHESPGPPARAAAESSAAPVIDPASPPEQVIEVEDDAVFLLEDVEAVWDQLKEDIRAVDKLIYAQLDGVVPINVEDRTVVLLATKGEWQRQKLEIERTRRRIERELTRALGSQCFFRVTVDKQEEMPDIKKQIQHIRRDELVRSALNIFDATIIAIDKP